MTDRERAEKAWIEIGNLGEVHVDLLTHIPNPFYPKLSNLAKGIIEQAFAEIRQDERRRCAEIARNHVCLAKLTKPPKYPCKENGGCGPVIAKAIESQGGGE